MVKAGDDKNNNRTASAINVSESTNPYSRAADTNIGGADFVRHLTVVSSAGSGVAIMHFYSINLLARQTMPFDTLCYTGNTPRQDGYL